MSSKSIIINIYRKDLKNMITDLEQGKKSLERIYRYYVMLDTVDKGKDVSFKLKEISRAIKKIESLICRAEKLLADEVFESVAVDAIDWIYEWVVEQWYYPETLNWFYMIPKNEEGQKYFDWEKAQYKYIITDLFDFHRFYVYDYDYCIAIA